MIDNICSVITTLVNAFIISRIVYHSTIYAASLLGHTGQLQHMLVPAANLTGGIFKLDSVLQYMHNVSATWEHLLVIIFVDYYVVNALNEWVNNEAMF